MPVIYTVGHSTHDLDRFLGLLSPLGVDTVVDVRSNPFSVMAPDFSRPHLEDALPRRGLGYVFMGDRLGGRPTDSSQYDDAGRALYYLMSQTDTFLEAIDVLIGRSTRHRMALMCSEGRPHECHRHLLVGRVLKHRGIDVRHIGPGGGLVSPPPSISESLFPMAEDASWKSVRSVLRAGPQKIFSKP